MSKLCFTHNRLRVKFLEKAEKFYTEYMGMKILDKVETEKDTISYIGYSDLASGRLDVKRGLLELTSSKTSHGEGKRNCNQTGDQVYWKIGVNLPDVKLAVERLNAKEQYVSAPSQFMEIGYLCHLKDSEHFSIELLQTTFERNFKKQEADSSPLGQKGTLGMVTIRSSDIDKTLNFYRDHLGMKVLCHETLEKFGFHLYFLAFTDESPPDADIDAVVNREWTYQRPYMVLEIQAFYGGQDVKPFDELTAADTGFQGLGMACAQLESFKDNLHNKNIPIEQYCPCDPVMSNKPSFIVRDPDNIPIRFTEL